MAPTATVTGVRAAQTVRLPIACCRTTMALRWAVPALACRRSRRHRHCFCRPVHARAGVARIVATSEHWYEEEEEFDAMTDAMTPKSVVLVCAPSAGSSGGLEALRSYLQPLAFNQAFASSEAMPFAQQLWAGRDRAPYFLKVRSRAALDAAGEADASAAAAAAAEVWQELLQQNWRVELDAGLGVAGPHSEALLLVLSPAAAACLLAAADAAVPAGGLPEGGVSVLQVGGTQAGDPLDWRLLQKQAVLLGAVPAAGASIDAALATAAAAH